MQVTTRDLRPVERACSSRLDEMMAVVNSVSAAVPAPAHQMWGAMKCSFSQFWRGQCVLGWGGGRWGHLVCHDGPAGCASVCGNDDAAVEEGADNGGAGACGFGEGHTLGVEGGIAVVVGEVEAGHGGGGGG